MLKRVNSAGLDTWFEGIDDPLFFSIFFIHPRITIQFFKMVDEYPAQTLTQSRPKTILCADYLKIVIL